MSLRTILVLAGALAALLILLVTCTSERTLGLGPTAVVTAGR